MSVPSIVVIIPVYNQEKYLGECLSSLTRQAEYDRCRVIVVNDGSTDATAEILDEFERDFDNVTVIHQANAGLGAARNAGLAAVDRGDEHAYVSFLDSDDYLAEGYLTQVFDAMHGRPDVIVTRIEGVPSTPAWDWNVVYDNGRRWFDSVSRCPLLLHDISACDKIVRLSLIDQHGLRFAESTHFEDLWFSPEALLRAQGIVLVPQARYCYRMDTGVSIMSSVHSIAQNFWDHLRGAEHILSLRDSLDPSLHGLVEEVSVHTNQWFIHRAGDVMDEASFHEYFQESCRVFAGIDPEVVCSTTTSWPARRAYLDVLAGDEERFGRKAPSFGEASVVGTEIVHSPRAGGLDPEQVVRGIARQSHPLRAWLGYFDVTAAGIEFHGHVKVEGLAASEPALRITPGLMFAGRGFPGEWEQRGDALGNEPDELWSGFKIVLPVGLGGVGGGRHTVRFRLVPEVSDGESVGVECSVSANAGYLREARLIEIGRHNFVPVTDGQNRVEFTVGRRRRFANVLSWRTARARAALQAKQPFARLKAAAVVLRTIPSRPVWLFAERGDTAQDNSAALFRWVRHHEKSVAAYYIIDKDSAQRQRVAEVGHVVDRGSLLHVLLVLRAQVFVSGFDIDRYMLPPKWDLVAYRRHLAWFLGTARVFLNHGVSYTDVSAHLTRRYVGADLFFTSAEPEADYVRRTMGYGPRVVTSGLPRFDLLERRPSTPRRILFMPTWRAYLSTGEPGSVEHTRFVESDYWRFIEGFLSSHDLAETLERHDLVLEVYPHYEVAPLISSIVRSGGRIEVIDQAQRSVRDAIAEAALFVTDWTSVFFDAAYAGTPIVHAPFDAEDFLGQHYRPGFFDFDTDAFGPVETTPEGVVGAIAAYAERDFVREDVYERRAQEFFAVRGDHSRRAYEAIQEMLRTRR